MGRDTTCKRDGRHVAPPAKGTAPNRHTAGVHTNRAARRRGAVAPGSAWALVTGAGTGIGRSFAKQLAAAGYNLVLAGREIKSLEAVRGEILAAAGVTSGLTGGIPRERKIPNVGTSVGCKAQLAATANRTLPEAVRAIDESCEAGREESALGGYSELETVRGSAAAGGTRERTESEANTETGTKTEDAPVRGSHPVVRILAADLARAEASDELYAAVRGMGIEIDVLINNAGVFSFRDILDTPAERIERMILLHDLTLTKNCLAFGREMAERGRGWILNMSSFSIWMPFPGMALYTATKAYVRAFSVAFAKEMRERGVRVTAVCPAGVATDLYGLTLRWQRIGLRLGVLISADSCARRSLGALWRGRRTIVPDWWNRIWIPLCKLLPMWALRPLRRFTMKFQK